MESSSSTPAVELRGITKVFPGVVANDGVDLALYRGEVHCLLGENGAGKSTLMHILAGMYQPDAGTIAIDGQEAEIHSPEDALALGVGMVYQHPTLVPTFTVLENLLLSAGGSFRLDRSQARASLRELAARLGTEIDGSAVVGRLPLGRQQQVEIVKALSAGSQIIVLDEPTAMLTPREVDDLGTVLRSLETQGLAVVVITHKLREALVFGDRITVLREGRVAGRLGPEQLLSTEAEEVRRAIVGMMFGEEGAGGPAPGEGEATVVGPMGVPELADGVMSARPARELPPEVVLSLEEVSMKPGPQEAGLSGISFEVRRGEIFGIAGIDGNGQRELAEAIAGQRRVSDGRIRLGDEDVTRASVAERQRLGLGYVTDDRLGEGMVANLPLSLNLLLKRIGEQPFWSRTRRISRASVTEAAEVLTAEFDIRAPDVHTRGGVLSGGNIQKVLLARELSFHPKAVVYNKPTHGLDLKTTIAIRQRVSELSDTEGVAAVLMSNDLDELVELCDRIAVLYRGRLAGIVDNRGAGVAEQVGELMVGGEDRT